MCIDYILPCTGIDLHCVTSHMQDPHEGLRCSPLGVNFAVKKAPLLSGARKPFKKSLHKVRYVEVICTMQDFMQG